MRRSKEETKQQLLDAGAELLFENGIPEAVNIKLADACRRLEVTSGAAYQIWRRQEDYQLDLTLHVVNSFNWATDMVSVAVDAAVAEYDDPEVVIRNVGLAYFKRLVSSPHFYVLLHLWSVKDPRPELETAMGQSYDYVKSGLNQIFMGAITAFGLELAPGRSLDDMSVMATAVSEGMAMRYRFDPDSIKSGELYVEALIGLFRQFTQPIDPVGQPDFS